MEIFVYSYNLKNNQIGRRKVVWLMPPNIAAEVLCEIELCGDELRMAQANDDQRYFLTKVKEHIEAEKKKAQDNIDAITYALEKLKEFETPLLPCPFCGSKVTLNDAVAPKWAVINCTKCRAEMRVNGKTREEARSEATKKWNARVAKL